MRSMWVAPPVLSLAVMLVAACGEKEEAQPSPPPPAVEVLSLEAQPVSNIVELPGRVEAVEMAEVRARVDGIVKERLYEEGTRVDAGEKLFQIDPRQMQAELNAAEAMLARARATARSAAQDVERYDGLVEKQAISEQEFDTAQARLRTAQADVAEAEAALEAVKLNLGYTSVESPISGVAGRAEVTVGALVKAGEATLMTSVEKLDPVYVNFSQASADLLALRADIASGELDLPDGSRVEVRLLLENGSEYPHPGYVDFLAMSIDESTGTVAARAQVPNPDRALLPGQFVRTKIYAGKRVDGLVVPQRSVIMTNSGASVMLVDKDDKAESREVSLGNMQNGNWVVQDGLEAGDRIIVEGWQDARPGEPVRPREAKESGEAEAE
ncbi:efflux RND transporter periplasmic adaptor subunit [Allohahella marinimesophila]|uniref:Efflux RND transporter periplasmic adaptor subunit n=1 Tax=Allohahella marinimesophila TaxID=1054972 RepID=A0ABP7Q0R1_9GAMM